MSQKVLRRIIRFGGSYAAITIPKTMAESLGEYVWIFMEPDGSLKITRAKIE